MSYQIKWAKRISTISEQDLLTCPLWKWAVSYVDDDADAQEEVGDETYVEPIEESRIQNGSCIAAAELTLANGKKLIGALELTIEGGKLRHWMPLTVFWNGEYLGDFDPHPRVAAGLCSVMHLEEDEIFPITWKSIAAVEGTGKHVGGTVAKFMELLPHPMADVSSFEPCDGEAGR
jgi:hypothetical protein